MKLLMHEVEQKGSKTVLKTQWRDKSRRATNVVMAKKPADGFSPSTSIEFEDKAHLFGLMSGFAEIAWQRGWRPRGLVATLAHVATNYKEPKAE